MATTRGLSIEASWEGDVRGRWFLRPRGRLRVGPSAECDIVVPEGVLPTRELVQLDGDAATFVLDLPAGSLLSMPQDASRDAYRQPAWQCVEAGPQRFVRETAVDLRVGPWRLAVRPVELEPLPRRRGPWAGLPLHALVASVSLHALLIGLALSTPPATARLSPGEPEEPVYFAAHFARSTPTDCTCLRLSRSTLALPTISLSYEVSGPPGLDEQSDALAALLQRPAVQSCLVEHCRWPAQGAAAFDVVVHPGGRLGLGPTTGCARGAERCLAGHLRRVKLPSTTLRFHHVRVERPRSE